jgi:hypothetical protein
MLREYERDGLRDSLIRAVALPGKMRQGGMGSRARFFGIVIPALSAQAAQMGLSCALRGSWFQLCLTRLPAGANWTGMARRANAGGRGWKVVAFLRIGNRA